MAPRLHLVPPAPEPAASPFPASRPTFEQLYDAHFAFSWRVLRHLGLSGSTLNDACQELWLVVHRRLPDLELRGAMRTWLFGIAVNVARNHRRSESRRRDGAELSVDLPDVGADPEARHAARQTWTAVQRFLSTCDETDRWIFVFNVVEQMSAAETAQALSIDIGAVYQRVRVLKRAVKRWLEGLDR